MPKRNPWKIHVITQAKKKQLDTDKKINKLNRKYKKNRSKL